MRTTWPYLGKESEDALPQEGGCLVPRSPHGLVTVQGQQGDWRAQAGTLRALLRGSTGSGC